MADASGAEEGKIAPWLFTQYTLPDCQQLLPPEGDGETTPWYTSDCQTGEDGLCKTSLYPVESFSISHAADLGDTESSKDDKCVTWEQHGAANKLGLGKNGGISVLWLAGAVAAWLVML